MQVLEKKQMNFAVGEEQESAGIQQCFENQFCLKIGLIDASDNFPNPNPRGETPNWRQDPIPHSRKPET